MKLPFIIPISGGGNNYHGYNDAAHDQDDLLEFDGADDFGSESAETFDDYMWMENEEEFDKTEMARLEEEELIKQCMEHAQDDEEDEQLHYVWLEQYDTTSDVREALMSTNIENSTLNPLAKEFIPSAVTH